MTGAAGDFAVHGDAPAQAHRHAAASFFTFSLHFSS